MNAVTHTFTGNGTFTFTFSDLYGNPGSIIANVTWIDKVKPVVTLNNSGMIYIEYGNTYSDAGATANDNIDGNITIGIITSGTVNA